MSFTDGHPKLGGRQAGTPNRLTGAFREALQIVYEDIGGHEAFTEWAKDNPTDFYRICARLIPVEIKDSSAEKTIVIVNRSVLREQPGTVPLIEDQSDDADEGAP
jgi:hypothetical protein